MAHNSLGFSMALISGPVLREANILENTRMLLML